MNQHDNWPGPWPQSRSGFTGQAGGLLLRRLSKKMLKMGAELVRYVLVQLEIYGRTVRIDRDTAEQRRFSSTSTLFGLNVA